jgi:hypothetical protein
VEWENVSLKLIRGTPKFRVRAPSFLSDEVVEFVRERMKQARGAGRSE